MENAMKDNQDGIKQILIILVDISGYTNFIKLHKISLLHAEKIIGELMECMLDQVELPVIAHEILGDAISLYALDDGSPGLADKVYSQLEKYFMAFRKREAYLLRECGFCTCDACNKVGQLNLKAILHAGKAAFTSVRNNQKIAGVDVITAHRLLKNSIDSDEYILVTDSFWNMCKLVDKIEFIEHTEHCEGVGPIHGWVKQFEAVKEINETISPFMKFKFLLKVDAHMLARFFGKKSLEFRNLPSLN